MNAIHQIRLLGLLSLLIRFLLGLAGATSAFNRTCGEVKFLHVNGHASMQARCAPTAERGVRWILLEEQPRDVYRRRHRGACCRGSVSVPALPYLPPPPSRWRSQVLMAAVKAGRVQKIIREEKGKGKWTNLYFFFPSATVAASVTCVITARSLIPLHVGCECRSGQYLLDGMPITHRSVFRLGKSFFFFFIIAFSPLCFSRPRPALQIKGQRTPPWSTRPWGLLCYERCGNLLLTVLIAPRA